jgi:hypothetical protein
LADDVPVDFEVIRLAWEIAFQPSLRDLGHWQFRNPALKRRARCA